jgi:hypothetical protein
MGKYFIYYKKSIMHEIIHFFFSKKHDNKNTIKDMLYGRSLMKNHRLFHDIEICTSSFLPLIFPSDVKIHYLYKKTFVRFSIYGNNYDNNHFNGLFNIRYNEVNTSSNSDVNTSSNKLFTVNIWILIIIMSILFCFIKKIDSYNGNNFL